MMNGALPEDLDRKSFTEAEVEMWEAFKKENPIGRVLTLEVECSADFGCYFRMHKPFVAFMQVINMGIKGKVSYPEDYPSIGERLTVEIVGYSDQHTDVIGKVLLAISKK